eukprot:CAMPEP_0113274610 /NCGR_PEP_ID=MMETSP0008_2-20120614/24497_1 /TAXON_ID=97485 /ORGANISM="Prymnesium parvum" /LENGTH=56 /DNA_ID=CAMNT_0000124247 /DNA_START=6 /DNA_END=172 /DNA_ORIENTATION=+ /assembly_acc=CAM_ASM_000153
MLSVNKDAVLAAVQTDCRALEWTLQWEDATLRADKDVVLAVVQDSGRALRWADAAL